MMNSDSDGETQVNKLDENNLLGGLSSGFSSELDEAEFMSSVLPEDEIRHGQETQIDRSFEVDEHHGQQIQASYPPDDIDDEHHEQQTQTSQPPEDQLGNRGDEEQDPSAKRRKVMQPEIKQSKYVDPFPKGDIALAEIRHLDDGTIWKPIQLLTGRRNLCWSHFLARDANIREGKCKHCGEVIKSASSLQDRISIVNYRKHLEKEHKIGTKDNYYISQRAKREAARVRTIVNNPELRVAEKSASEQHAMLSTLLEPSRREQLDELFESSANSFSKSKLLSLICVAYNLPLKFLNVRNIRLLFERLGLWVKVDPGRLVDHITEYAENIDCFIRASIASVPLDSHLILGSSTLTTSSEENKRIVSPFISETLSSVLQTPFFSLTGNIYGGKYFIMSLVYCDGDYSTQRYLPVKVIAFDSATDLTPNFIEDQIHTVMESIKSLHRVNFSITPSILADEVRSVLIFRDDKYSKMKFHNCFVSILTKAVLPFFGHSSNTVVNDGSDEVNSNRTIIDEIFNLSKVDIYDSMFGKINRFLAEIQYDDSIFERFEKDGGAASVKKTLLKMNRFNKNQPSQAVAFLRSFQSNEEYIQQLNKYLEEESFTLGDFEMVSVMTSFLSAIYSLCFVFSLPTPNFQNILLAVVAIENHLQYALENVVTNKVQHLLINQLDYFVEYRDRIVNDDDILLSLFFSPAILRNEQLLRFLYSDASEEDLMKRIAKAAKVVLRRFLKTDKDKSDTPSGTTEIATDTTDMATNRTRLPFVEYSNTNGGIVDVDYLLDLYLDAQLMLDMKDFKEMIFKEYDTFFTQQLQISQYTKSGDMFITKVEKRVLSDLDALVNVHIPISNSFLQHYMDLEIGVVFTVLIKYIFTLRPSSYISNLAYLAKFTPANKDIILDDILKVRIFSEQFAISSIIWEEDDLFTICNTADSANILYSLAGNRL